jgi:hypothetical protein
LNSLNGSIHLPSSGREVENAFQARPFVSPDPIQQATDPSVKVIGLDLGLSDYAELEARWIDRSLALEAGLRRVDSLSGAEVVGLEQLVGRQAAELDFFKGALRRVEARRQNKDTSGGAASTSKSK